MFGHRKLDSKSVVGAKGNDMKYQISSLSLHWKWQRRSTSVKELTAKWSSLMIYASWRLGSVQLMKSLFNALVRNSSSACIQQVNNFITHKKFLVAHTSTHRATRKKENVNYMETEWKQSLIVSKQKKLPRNNENKNRFFPHSKLN